MFDMDNKDVKERLSPIKQIFVGYQFLDYPPENLESASALLDDSGLVNLQFNRSFAVNFTENERQVKLLLKMIKATDPAKNVVVFTIVSEPPATQQDEQQDAGECVDFAISELHLSDIEYDSVAGSQFFELPIWDVFGVLVMGKLRVLVEGCRSIRAIAKSHIFE